MKKKKKTSLLVIENQAPGEDIVLRLESLEKMNDSLRKTIENNTGQLDLLRDILRKI
jgi:hypothetical protein